MGSPADVAHDAFLQHKQPYLNVPFFVLRTVVYFALWLFWGYRVNHMADKQDETGDPTLADRMRAFSAPGVLVFTMTGTFAYIDWLLSADARIFLDSVWRDDPDRRLLQTFALRSSCWLSFLEEMGFRDA